MKKRLLQHLLMLTKFSLYGFFLQCFLANALFAIDGNAQKPSLKEALVNIHINEGRIDQVLESIEQQTEFSFVYSSANLDSEKKVTINVNDQALSEVLMELSKQANIKFKQVNKNISIQRMDEEEEGIGYIKAPQDPLATVTGQVTDETTGEGLPGVTVLVKGTSNGTVTNLDGQYSIQVQNESDTLVYSFIGYATKELPVNGRTTINVSLSEDVKSLEEVVVVGYGTQRRQDVTGAISTIKTEDIVTQGSNTVEKSLQGRVAGVQVESAGGDPGSGVRILVRGTGSLNNNNPLYIVDGVQVDNINSLAPSDIASMDILKDASAAAIYGSRAANGVVLITTKSGRKGETKIDFNGYYGVQEITRKLDLLNASEWARVSNAAHDNAGQERLEVAQNEAALGEGVDWQDQIYRTAPMQNYNLSAGGGGENYTYSISGGYLNQEGIVKRTDYDRYNLRIKSDFTKGRVKVGETIILSKENAHPLTGGIGGQGGNPVGSAIKMVPVFDIYNPDAVGGYGGAYGNVVDIANPVAQLYLRDIESTTNKAIINAFAEVSILDELKYKFNFGYTNTSATYFEYTRPYQVGALFTNLDSDLYENRAQTNYFLQEHTLSYDKMFGKHNVQALIGYTFQNTDYRILEGWKSGMPEGVSVLNAGTTNTAVGSEAWENALLSYLGRLVYSYDDRYVLTAILRRDGSSRFGNGYKYGNFPSLALAWNASSESFFEPFESTISMLKLRASYGELGNQEIPDYRFIPAISTNLNYVVGDGQQLWPGGIQRAFATPDIRWESSRTFDVGTDMGFLSNKIFFTADYFIRKNTDILLQVPIPLSTGASSESPYINAGEITNRGFEAALSYNNTVNGFGYQFTGTFTAINNEVDNLGTGSQQIFGGQPTHHGASATVTQAGLPVGSFYLIKTDGIFNSQEEVDAHSYEGELIQPNAQPGDIRFVDYNNDGQIDQNDRQYLGSPNPDFSYGFGGNLDYKGFDLNFFFQGTHGNKIYNGLRQDLESMNLNFNYARTTLNAWTPDNRTDFPRAVINDPNLNSQTSDRFLEDGSYLRFRTLQLGYTLPSGVLETAKISNCRVYLSFDNLFTLTDYQGYNPDLGRTGSVLDRGVDFGHAAYPLARTSMVGVQLSF